MSCCVPCVRLFVSCPSPRAQCFAAALAEEFAPELQQAGEAAEAVSAALEAEGGLSALEARLAAAAAGGVEEPEVEQFLSLKQEFHEALQEMGECGGSAAGRGLHHRRVMRLAACRVDVEHRHPL